MDNAIPPDNEGLGDNTNILIVDDQPENLRLLSTILQKEGYTVRPALNGTAALNAVMHTPADLVLLDMRMPEIDGIEVCRRLKDNPSTNHIPVIFISAADEPSAKIAGFQAGGIDYITKPFQPDEVLARIRIQLELLKTQKKLKEAYQNLEDKVRERTIELTRTNDALRESEAKYRTLNENLPLGVFRTTIYGRLLSANQSMANMFGFDKFGPDMEKMITEENRKNEYSRRFLDAIKTSRKLTGFEFTLTRSDGSVFFANVSGTISSDPKTGEKFIDGILEDITEKKEIEERNKTLEKQIHQTQKMEAIGTLAGGIAHDFNNILAAILGFTELASLGYNHGKNIKEMLLKISSAGLRARDLVNQILTFSRQTDILHNPISITPLFNETLRFLSASLPASISIDYEFAETDKKVLADPTQIQQILMNLCTNAAHAMDGKGALKLKLSAVAVNNDNDSDTKNLPAGEYLMLSVSDTGHGIRPEVIDRIFDPFFTTKKTGEGTGMGLSVVHGIVRQMSGEIRVKSEPGQGTTFDILLPVYQGVSDEMNNQEDEGPVRGSGTILLVDDEDLIVESTQTILTHLGYTVISKSNSQDALDCFKAAPHDFDLILTDMTMPGMTGLELAQKIREISPEIPILMSSGFSARISDQAREESGITAILMKPVLAKDLSRAIKDALDAANN